ncbi:MAG: hypothetical protein AAGA11_18460 [Pseudomonadota bacterium]
MFEIRGDSYSSLLGSHGFEEYRLHCWLPLSRIVHDRMTDRPKDLLSDAGLFAAPIIFAIAAVVLEVVGLIFGVSSALLNKITIFLVYCVCFSLFFQQVFIKSATVKNATE